MTSAIYHYGLNLSFHAFTLFLPAIIKGLGYSSVVANLMTVPVYLWGMVVFGIIAYISDRLQKRAVVIAGPARCFGI